jgi:ABC-2 type transport system permease protein
MKNLLLLLKIHFKNAYNINKLLKTNKKKLVLIILFALYIVVSLFSTFFIYAQSAADFLSKYNLISYMIVLFYIVAAFATFMFTIYNAKSSMFNANDNDLLLSMPLKSSTILASRLLYITIWNLISSIFIMIPVYTVYAMNVKVEFMYYLSAFAVFLFLPLIPTILASIIGYVIAYFTSKSNAKNWFELIMSFAFMIIIYVGMAKIGDIMNYLVTHIDNFQTILKWGFYPVYLVSEIFTNYSFTSLIIYVVLNVSLFAVFTYILSIKFKSITAKLQENRAKSNYVMKELKSTSVSKTLFNKEVKRYLSSPIYVFNTSFGAIMMLVGAIASIFYDKDQILKAMEINMGSGGIFPLLVVAVIFITFMSSTTSASISIEGNNYWILKTLPLRPRDVFKGKILLNVLLNVPAGIVALIMFYFTLGLNLTQLLILIALMALASVVEAYWGLLVNLKFPKMDAVNDVVIVKRSLSVMVALLVPMAIILGMAGAYSEISDVIPFNTMLVIIFVTLFIMYFIEKYVLDTWGAKRFKEIN